MKLISSATCNIKFVILGFFLLNINVLAAQNASVCPIETVTAVAPKSELRSTSHVNEVLFAPFARWNQLNRVKFADDQKATIQLTNMARSRVVMGNNLGFQIPEGATINGITLMMKGQSDLYQNIDEIEMYLLDRYGEVKGQNKKNTAKLQKAWSVDRDGKDKVWMYGSSTDTWGTSWTVADINSPDFGYQFQIRSITNDTINISLDQISLQVDYTPAFSFCDSKCLTFHIDKFEQFGSYRWFVPDGFQMVSASTHNPTIDLKITTATYGLYQICVDVFNKDGSFAERCCRNILYQDCLSSVIKGNVWADHNDNKTKEPTDGSLANVVLVLYNSSGTPIDTTMSDVLGNYEFNKLAEGNYYIKSAILSDTRMILFSPLNPDTNSDITNVFGLGTTDLIHVDIAKIVSNIDFGYTPLVDIGDLVWEDSNYNGLQDGSELGIKDVKIYLLDNNGIKLDSTLTNVDGQYAFSKIPANRYKLKFGISDPYFATFKNNTNNNKNSKIDSLGNTAAFNIFKGTKSDIDAGLYRFAAVGDQVWEDKNGDGIFNNTHEEGVAGVILRLTGQTGNGASVSKTTTTDDQGNYIFAKLFPGVYNINVTLPTGFFETFPNIGDDVSDSDMVGGQISNVQLVSGQNAKEWDAGIYRKASLGDFVWEDVNGNGLQDSGEPGIGDIQVSLFKDSATVALATASTNASGFYLFNDLIPGNYHVGIDIPASFQVTLPGKTPENFNSDIIGSKSNHISIMSGENNANIDAGLLRYGSIGDFVWEDKNGNGIQENGEVGITGVRITLSGTDAWGQNISLSTTTDITGFYSFTNLIPGVYNVSVEIPSGYKFVPSQRGNDKEKDSDGINGLVSNIVVTSNQHIGNIDFGFYKVGQIGDFVWLDTNGNGIQDDNETGISGVTILLNGLGGDGNSYQFTTQTDANGVYSFTDLYPGNYELTINIPTDYVLSKANQGTNRTKDADFDASGKANITLISGQNGAEIDAGFYKYGNIGDFVWHDLNANGKQDVNEPGLSAIDIMLEGNTNTGEPMLLFTTTDTDGKYFFNNLAPGVYSIKVTLPSGYELTIAKVGNTDTDSDFQNLTSTNIMILSGSNVANIDAGLYQRSSIGDFVWLDANGNGIQDVGEVGIADITVTLSGTDIFGNLVTQITTTSNTGFYSFVNVIPGTYSLNFSLPTHFTNTVIGAGSNENVDSDAINNNITNIILLSGQKRDDLDCGNFEGGSIGDFVWEDTNGNGIQDIDESGLSGIQVTLTGENGFSSVTTTDSNGTYRFVNLVPGVYSLTFAAPNGYIWTTAIQGNDLLNSDVVNGKIENISLLSGQQLLQYDGGLFRYGQIGDFVWHDANFNGIQDVDEMGLEGVNITISGVDGLGNQINKSIKTDQNGQYLFSDLVPGTYSIKADLPQGFQFTLAKATTDVTKDSESNNGESSGIIIKSGSFIADIDFGLVKSITVGDFVWDDTNANGIQDASENGLANISLNLLGTSFDGSSVNQSILTDQKGKYLFANVFPGNYTITIQIPADYTPTKVVAGSDPNTDSNLSETLNTVTFTLNSDDLSIDFGLVKTGCIGDLVWEDLNCNGIREINEPGVEGIQVVIQGMDLFSRIVEDTLKTSQDGRYIFDKLRPGIYFINTILDNGYEYSMAVPNMIEILSGSKFLDIDMPIFKRGNIGDMVWIDANNNGLQDMGEAGLSNVKVNLTGTTNVDAVNLETITDTDGKYLFDNLKPGQYQLTFATPIGYNTTLQNAGNPDLDSDINSSGSTGVFALISNENKRSMDAGYRLVTDASIGSLVWEDLNANGIREAGETGISDVTLSLLGVSITGANVALTTTSDANGNYSFGNLQPGTYVIRSTIPAGYLYTLQDATNDDNDSDANPSIGETGPISLTPGMAINNVDFGLYRNGSIGDFVWTDGNNNGLQDVGELGLANVKVNISGTTSEGQVNQETTTNTEGKYTFDHLRPGQYQLTFVTPIGYNTTLQNAGNPDLDSDINSSGSTGMFALISNENKRSMDAGYRLVTDASIGSLVWEDLNANGIREAGEPGISDVTLSLLGVSITGTNVALTTTSDANGNYSFGNLQPGTYVIRSTIPAGYLYTLQDATNDDNDSDANPSIGETGPISLTPGMAINNVDFGLYRNGSIGDFVWADRNNNGLQDVGELGLDNVKVNISGTTSEGQVNQETTTNTEGKYTFDHLRPGQYQLTFATPIGYNTTLQNAGNPDLDSDINSSGSTGMFALISNENKRNIDAGYRLVTDASIGSLVWEDINANGIREAGEPGISDVTLSLLGVSITGANVALTTTSDANGNYIFGNLQPGTYVIRSTIPAGYLYTLQDATNDDNDSDANPSIGETGPISLTPGMAINNVDFGLYRNGSIGDFVWADINNNGLQDAGEAGINGVLLYLYDQNGLVIQTQATNAEGFYIFDQVTPGNYTVRAEVPSNYTVALFNQTPSNLNSDFQTVNGIVTTNVFDIRSGDSQLGIDLGLVPVAVSAKIGGVVWSDNNGNGLFDNDEPFKNMVKVYLLSQSKDTLASTFTDVMGRYVFDDLASGTYFVTFPILADSLFTYYRQGSNLDINNSVTNKSEGLSESIVLNNTDKLNINAGYVGFSSLGDFTWLDANENGLQDINELGLNNIKVYLLSESDVILDSTLTAINTITNTRGYYKFDDLPYGNYKLRFETKENFRFSTSLTSDLNLNSDANENTGVTALINVMPNQDKTDIDAGYILIAPVTGNIKGIVWQDQNNSKVKESIEPVLSGILISLFALDGTMISTATSDAAGGYEFMDIPFGDYYLKAALDPTKVFVRYQGQSVPNDSDISNDFGVGTTRALTVFPGTTLDNVDFGYATKISIGDFVWLDDNNNGLQDLGEPGIQGILVKLVNESNITEASVMTDATGRYQLQEIAEGSYVVEFQKLDGFVFSQNNASNNNLNSKPNPDTGKTLLLPFTSATQFTNLDAGLVRAGVIGDEVWIDLNGNGIRQANEPGINGIRVELFNASNQKLDETVTTNNPNSQNVGYYNFKNVRPGNYYVKFNIPANYLISPPLVGSEDTDNNITNTNGPNTTDFFAVSPGQNISNIDAGIYLPATIGDFVWHDTNRNGVQDSGEPGVANVKVQLFAQSGALLASTTTNAQGNYTFTGLRQRLYYLQFELPNGFEFSTQYAGSDIAKDSDVDPTGTTPLISLAHGSTLLEIDAGLVSSNLRLIMGRVWDDKNQDGIRTLDEPLLSNVKVELKDANQSVVKTFITNHAGMYCVESGKTGNHFIQVEGLENYIYTIKSAGIDNTMDSDVDENGTSNAVMFSDSYLMKYIDAGMYYKLTGSLKGVVWVDNNNNNIRDMADSYLSNVVIFLFNKNKIFVKSVKSNDLGQYTLKNLDPGQYYCLVPQYPDKDFVRYNNVALDGTNSEITNQYGVGTSRLIQINGGEVMESFDFGYLQVSKIESKPDLSDVRLYPNPSVFHLTIALPEGSERAEYYIVNSMGKIVNQGILDQKSVTLDTENMITGRYSIHIYDGKKKWVKPFTKITN